MNERERALLVDALSSAIADGGQSLGQVPALLKRLLREGAWKDFETRLGKPVHHDRFEDFVVTQPLAGLGADVGLVRNIVKDDVEAIDLLAEVLEVPKGQAGQQLHANSSNITISVRGTTEAYALRRLRKARPDLHTRVLAGELSPHKAMIEAGFRSKTITIALDSPRAAATLIRKASPEFIEELRRLLA